MSPLITLDYAKKHLRLDHDADDTDLARKISAASVMLVAYLKDGAFEFLDQYLELLDGMSVPADVQSACATLVGMMFDDRDGTSTREYWSQGYLPHAVTAQIYMRRDPALA